MRLFRSEQTRARLRVSTQRWDKRYGYEARSLDTVVGYLSYEEAAHGRQGIVRSSFGLLNECAARLCDNRDMLLSGLGRAWRQLFELLCGCSREELIRSPQ